MKYHIISSLFLALLSLNISAAIEDAPHQASSRMHDILHIHSDIIQKWTKNPILLESVRQHNDKRQTLAEIQQIDRQWLAGEIEDYSLSLQHNPAGQFLKQKILENPLYTEAFLCGEQGAVAGEYPKTTDYWQGDEDKFRQSYYSGNGRVYFGAIELDQSTQQVSIQISVPVIDQGKTIGVLIVGLKNI